MLPLSNISFPFPLFSFDIRRFLTTSIWRRWYGRSAFYRIAMSMYFFFFSIKFFFFLPLSRDYTWSLIERVIFYFLFSISYFLSSIFYSFSLSSGNQRIDSGLVQVQASLLVLLWYTSSLPFLSFLLHSMRTPFFRDLYALLCFVLCIIVSLRIHLDSPLVFYLSIEIPVNETFYSSLSAFSVSFVIYIFARALSLLILFCYA